MITSDDYLKLLHDAGIDTQRLSVIIHILERTDPKTNIFFGSYDTIAKKTGVSHSTVVKTIKAMMSAEYIRQVKNGVWEITNTSIFDPPKDGHGIMMRIRNYGNSAGDN